MRSLALKGIFCSLLLLSAVSCKKKNIISQATSDDNTIKKYISENGLNATATGSGLYYVITSQGTGVQPSASSFITVNYKGYLTNGTTFDQNKSYSSTLSSNIQGWREGLLLFKKGGKGKLLIPSALGYGSSSSTNIPANSVLIFDIELLDVK